MISNFDRDVINNVLSKLAADIHTDLKGVKPAKVSVTKPDQAQCVKGAK